VPPSPAKSKIVCDVLVRERLLRPDAVESIVGRATRSGERVEEVILETGLVGETEMLKALATSPVSRITSSTRRGPWST
jgi:hypothetical protein